jgi:hypothetical protein
MQIRLVIWMLLGAFASAGVALAQASGGLKPGSVLVAKMTGTVRMTDKDGTVTPVQDGMQVKESATVETFAASSVVLVFSNGATTQLGANTELVLEQYLQGEFSGEVSPAKITEEPSTSKTRLFMRRGELIGNVKKLKKDLGSEFTVRTPVGAAGIRGTTFRIVFRPTGTGDAFYTAPWSFELNTREGQVEFDPNTRGSSSNPTPTPGGQPPVNVDNGVQIILTVTTSAGPDGTPRVTVVPTIQSTVPIPSQILVQIERAAAELALAAERALFTSGGGSGGTITGTFTPEPGGGGAAGQGGQTTPPPQEPEPPRTTPGTG